MTSIEWLKEKYISQNCSLTIIDFDIAKTMHKAEIIDAYGVGMNDGCSYMTDGKTEFENREQYYQETFGSKESDDHIADISKMVEVPQQEISDEEIYKGSFEKESIDWHNGFIAGAKWYREQLKQKL
jgi:hypothetical protein